MKPVTLDLPSDNNTHYRAVITPGNPVTTCEIQHQAGTIYENHWRLMYHGMSICKHGDRYDMETGCRLALKSALRKPKKWDYAYEKQFRTAAWAAYLAKFPVSERRLHFSPGVEAQIIRAIVHRLIEKRLRENAREIFSSAGVMK